MERTYRALAVFVLARRSVREKDCGETEDDSHYVVSRDASANDEGTARQAGMLGALRELRRWRWYDCFLTVVSNASDDAQKPRVGPRM